MHANKIITIIISLVIACTHQSLSAMDPVDPAQEKEVLHNILINPILTFTLTHSFLDTFDLKQRIENVCKQIGIAPIKATHAHILSIQHPLLYIPLTQKRGAIYALHDHEIVGQIRFGRESHNYHIYLLLVHKKYRSQGLASALLLSTYATITALAQINGQETVTIFWEALPQDTAHGLSLEQLVAFYQKHGAHVDEDRSDEFTSMSITISLEK
jgi:GNAT superfamily N-acetyltransferase